MRIAVIADSHFSESSRFEECVRIHEWIAVDIAKRGVDLVLHSGDVYDKKSTPVERDAVARWAQHITETAPFVIVRGNHDALDDLPLLERLETLNPISVVETALVIRWAGAEIACMGWPQKASVLAASQADGRDVGEQAAADAMRNILRGLGAQFAEDGPRLFLAHAMVRGSVTSTGQPLVGCDLELGLDDLALVGADAYLLGHVHMPQQWKIGDAPVVYPGSPRRTAFGELEEKGYLLVEFEGRDLLSVEWIATPCAPMVHLEAHWAAEHVAPDDAVVPAGLVRLWDSDSEAKGAEVRLRYTTPSDTREAARAQALLLRDSLLTAGALSIKLEEEVKTVARARQPEIAAAVTLDGKLEALWEAQSNAPAAERRPRLLAKVHEIEGETNAA